MKDNGTAGRCGEEQKATNESYELVIVMKFRNEELWLEKVVPKAWKREGGGVDVNYVRYK